MIAYLIVSLLLLIISSISNLIFIASNHVENKIAAVIGLIIYFCMICWTIVLLV